MPSPDPRVDLGDQLLPEHAVAAVQALDRTCIRIISGDTPAAALSAAALLVLVARTHAHVEVLVDAPLPHNPWGATTLANLLMDMAPLRPTPQAQPDASMTISTSPKPGADRYLAPSTLTVSVTSEPFDERALSGLGSPGSGTPAFAPYGGMFAAAVVAADLFCAALSPLGLPAAARRTAFVWNLLDFTYKPAPPIPTMPRLRAWPRLLVAGCGSVGSSAAAALACDDLTGMSAAAVDGDTFDPLRNTFRYPAATATDTHGPKAVWVCQMLAAAGAVATPTVGPVSTWTRSQYEPGLDGVVVSSVDDVDGRYEVADVLARTTLSAAVRGLSFHVQREHLGDGLRCPFCDFVTIASPLAQAASDAALTGLAEQRIIELLHGGTCLQQADVDEMIGLGRVRPEAAPGLVGARLADLRNRLYAQAAIPSDGPSLEPPAPLSAPFVSWATGVLLAAEVAKQAHGLAPLNRRFETDMNGYPADFVHIRPADSSGRCACARAIRVRWMNALYPDALAESNAG